MLIRQIYGNYQAIGGTTEEIYDRWLSLYNWNGLNGELLELSDNFKYFLIEEVKYIHTRAVVFCCHWGWSYKGKPGKLIFGLASIKARKELDSIKVENFLTGAESIENNEFSTGWIPNSLDSLNSDGIIFKEYRTFNGAIKQNDKIELNKPDFSA